MISLQSLLWALTSVLFLCCAQGSPADPLPLRSLAKGAFSGIQEPTEQVIKDSNVWESLWSRHSSRAKNADHAPQVDFTKEMVIVVTMGRQTSGGYAVQIVKVEPEGEQLQIHVARKTPRPGSMALQALTAPFHMVAVPRSDLKPHFIEEEAAAR